MQTKKTIQEKLLKKLIFYKLLTFSKPETGKDNFYVPPKNWKAWLIYLWNFSNELFLCVGKEKKIFKFKKQNLCYAHFPRNWSFKNQWKFNYLPKFGKKNGEKFLISILHQNTLFLKNSWLVRPFRRQLKNSICLQNYYSAKMIIFSYFNSNQIKLLFNDPGAAITTAKNRVLFLAANKFFQENKIKKIILPFFELLEGRAIFLAAWANKIKTIPLVHGTTCLNSKDRVLEGSTFFWKSEPATLPSQVLCESQIESIYFKSKKINAKKVGILRKFDLLPKIQETDNILVLLDLHFYENYLMEIDKLNSYTKSKITVRLHPKISYKMIKHGKNCNFDFSESLYVCFKNIRPCEIWLGETGVLFQLKNNIEKILLLKIQSRNNTNPISLYASKYPQVFINNGQIKKLNLHTRKKLFKIFKKINIESK